MQFGADQDCHCGAEGCRKKLGVKPNKPKIPSSDAANCPKVKAILTNKSVCTLLLHAMHNFSMFLESTFC